MSDRIRATLEELIGLLDGVDFMTDEKRATRYMVEARDRLVEMRGGMIAAVNVMRFVEEFAGGQLAEDARKWLDQAHKVLGPDYPPPTKASEWRGGP